MRGSKEENRPDDSFEELPDDPDEVCGVHQVEGLEVLLVLAVKGLVRLPQPRHGRLVLAGKSVVEVNEAVVLLHKLVQSGHQVAQEAHVVQLLVARQFACRHHNHLQFEIQKYSKLHPRTLMNLVIAIKIVALI